MGCLGPRGGAVWRHRGRRTPSHRPRPAAWLDGVSRRASARRARRPARPAAYAAPRARAEGARRPPDHRFAVPGMNALPISVITGFLGSGKTTLLSRLLRDPALARTAVIVNEFGEVGLDHLLVEASDEEVILLEGGCLCCKVRGDLARTAGDLLARRARGEAAFDRIVIETSGLADPAPILQALMTDREIADALRLESVIATVDCAAGGATLDAHPQSVKQAALADRIVLTKTDLADSSALAERLRRLNPSAPQFTALHGVVDASLLFNASAYERPLHDHA